MPQEFPAIRLIALDLDLFAKQKKINCKLNILN